VAAAPSPLVLEFLMNDELLRASGGRRQDYGHMTDEEKMVRRRGGAEKSIDIIINHQLLLLRIRFKMRKRSSLALLCY